MANAAASSSGSRAHNQVWFAVRVPLPVDRVAALSDAAWSAFAGCYGMIDRRA